MLETINHYLQLGTGLVQQGNAEASAWTLGLAAALIAVTILRRQSDD